jgi:hypothetical protein
MGWHSAPDNPPRFPTSGFPEFGPKRALELAASNGRPVSDPLVLLEIKEATVFIDTLLKLVLGAIDATYDSRRLEREKY